MFQISIYLIIFLPAFLAKYLTNQNGLNTYLRIQNSYEEKHYVLYFFHIKQEWVKNNLQVKKYHPEKN